MSSLLSSPSLSKGVGLPDLVITMAVLSIVLGILAPRFVGGADRWIVNQATEEVVAVLYQARLEARRHGGAVVEARTGEGIVVRVSGGVEVARWVPEDALIHFEVAGVREVAELAFGPAGTGRFANATLRIQRGKVTREVVLSSHGRVRR